ncbi:MAG: uroporphyrinogen-III C-methyltransferase [Burkholderiaceae bacterium]|jgi:uroporphyrin-3 C-methyltransferase|nr:uroporphyrinogen-III C-methyltransferase [Burkholderiaceae bacterium]
MSSEPINAPPPVADGPMHAARAALAAIHPTAPLRGLRPGLVAAWLLAVAALIACALLWQKVDGMQQQLARQSADAGSLSLEARALARQVTEMARDNAAKVAVLESKFSDMSAYRAQLEDLVQTVTRVRDENLAVELETALRVAQDQSQLTGSVEPLLAALRTAERRLSRSIDPRLTPVARVVADDLERVKSASIVDVAGLLTRIDQLLRQIDELPLAGDVGHVRLDAAPRGNAAAEPSESWWRRWWQVVRDDVLGLLRVSRVERPEAGMLSPEQAFFVRENLKLRLLGARLSLLAHQYEAARTDLAAAQTSLGNWFDPASRRTQAAATLLQQIQSLTRAADLPHIQATLAALGNAIAANDESARGK